MTHLDPRLQVEDMLVHIQAVLTSEPGPLVARLCQIALQLLEEKQQLLILTPPPSLEEGTLQETMEGEAVCVLHFGSALEAEAWLQAVVEAALPPGTQMH